MTEDAVSNVSANHKVLISSPPGGLFGINSMFTVSSCVLNLRKTEPDPVKNLQNPLLPLSLLCVCVSMWGVGSTRSADHTDVCSLTLAPHTHVHTQGKRRRLLNQGIDGHTIYKEYYFIKSVKNKINPSATCWNHCLLMTTSS